MAVEDGRQMTTQAYLALINERLAASYNVEIPHTVGSTLYPLYARSHVQVGQYLFHRSITYEQMELNEHILCRVLMNPVTLQDVTSFVDELKGAVGELVRPSHEHMSSALTGVLIGQQGFTPDAIQKVGKSGFTRHFRLGLQGWCFLRLLGVDLTTGLVSANRRGKEVMRAFTPS